MKKKAWKKPKAAVRWGLYDSAGQLVLVVRRRDTAIYPHEMWHRVRVVPIERRKR